MGMHQPFASRRYNTHWVAFRFTTSFIHFSSVQSNSCKIILLAGRPNSAAVTLRLLITHVVPPFRKAPLRFTCIVQPPSYPDGKCTPAASYVASIVAATWLSFFSLIRKVAATLLLAPSWGSQALPFVPLSSALWRLATHATVRTSVPHS